MMQVPVQPKYDVFVSYRVTDVHVVRPIAEQLMAAGLKVWFDEYEILLSDREQWKKAIINGLTNCAFGICITNDRYAQSENCQMELKMLLDTIGPERIVEICYPHEPLAHSTYPNLQKAHVFEYVNLLKALDDIQSVISQDTYSSLVPPAAAENWHRLSSHGIHFSLDFGGWVVRKHWFRLFGGGNRRIATYHRTWNDNFIRGHLITGSMDVMRSPLTMEDHNDDRAYRNRALNLAERFFQAYLPQKPIGVHLLFVPERISQAAFTTEARQGVISRLYSVVVPSYKHGCDVELAFYFFYDGEVSEFCRQSYLMDRLVQSLRVENEPMKVATRDTSVQYKTIKAIDQLLSFGGANSIFLSQWLSRQLGKAVLRGDLNSVRELLNQGADPNIATIPGIDAKGRKNLGTPLMLAAEEGLEPIVIELLEHGAQVDITDSRGWTALFFAVENGYNNICELLLGFGADPNIRTAQLGTALMLAVIKGNPCMARLLVERGADMSFRDSIGKSALDFANKYGRSEIISIFK